MNAIGFFLRRLAWQFGIRRERARWNAVTRETQVLSEAQDLLGRLAWPNTANIDELTGEYWQIRDMDNQQAKLREESETLLAEIESHKESLAGIEGKYAEKIDVLRERKSKVMTEAGDINTEMEDIRSRDQAIRNRFGSLKRKLEVLKRHEGEDVSEEIERTRAALVQLKSEHDANSQEIEANDAKVRKVEESVQGVDAEIQGKRDEMKEESAELVADIGRKSKRVADISARIGALENSKSELSFQIGQYLSNNAENKSKDIQGVLRGYRPIVQKILSLKRSISYNQRLARRSRP